jgi:hypothetical protein
MSVQAQARLTLAAILTGQPESLVPVVYDGQSANAVRGTHNTEASLTDRGDVGLAMGHVWVDASHLTRPSRGARITVAGTEALVTRTQLDPCGALIRIDYQETRPVTGTTGIM